VLPSCSQLLPCRHQQSLNPTSECGLHFGRLDLQNMSIVVPITDRDVGFDFFGIVSSGFVWRRRCPMPDLDLTDGHHV
jgi:hypothetical protein